jgi:hypothetical protein
MSFLETIRQVLTPGASYPMVTLFPGGPIGNDVGLNPAAGPDGGSVPEPQVQGTGNSGQGTGQKTDTSLRGAVGTANFAGFLRDLGEYNPVMEGRSAFLVYEKMRRSDADVRAALMACKLPIRAAESQIVPGVKEGEQGFALAKELAQFAKENLFGGLESPTSTGQWVTQNFETVKENALLCLDFGCAAHEDLWHVDGDKVRLRKLAPRLPYTFYRYHVDDDGETLLFLEQYGYRGNNFVNVLVPAEKLAYFVNEQEGAYFYGRSVLRAAYQHWFLKSQIYRIDAISIERNGLGVPTIKQGVNVSAEDRKASQQWVQMLSAHESTGLSLPNGWEFALTGITGRIRDPHESIQHHSEMIMRSVLANFLTLGTTQTGSRALGGSMRDFFYLSLEAVSRKVDETITNSSIRRLVDYNYNLGADQKSLYPRLVTPNIIVTNPLELLEACKDAAKYDNDLLQPDDDTENWIRRKVGLPLKGKTARVRYAPVVERIQEMETGDEEIPVQNAQGQPQKAAGSRQPAAVGPNSVRPPAGDTQPGDTSKALPSGRMAVPAKERMRQATGGGQSAVGSGQSAKTQASETAVTLAGLDRGNTVAYNYAFAKRIPDPQYGESSGMTVSSHPPVYLGRWGQGVMGGYHSVTGGKLTVAQANAKLDQLEKQSPPAGVSPEEWKAGIAANRKGVSLAKSAPRSGSNPKAVEDHRWGAVQEAKKFEGQVAEEGGHWVTIDGSPVFIKF